ncbi:arylamine N-acetyltransferase family protein [Kroppenstedtia pulmonis]|uniref:arylamine N-acetyltransferase family protein n=1 Tax=Kroppenstedtia pulmonis TaxID=1380685 RepID=UPI001FECDD2B|nr:arylamine N-acetyltransferase [Kroppenstedtia pulmonis]
MVTQTYLERIGISEVKDANLQTLHELQEQHLYTVPFENIDIQIGKPIILDPDTIYDKVVLNRRGGFCYELNSLFGSLLRKLGFQVTMISGRVSTPSGGFGPEHDHMALIVCVDDHDYLVDVGFGDSCRVPLPLSGDKREDISGSYRIRPKHGHPGQYKLEKRINKRWLTEYLFRTTPKKLEDFTLMCQHHQISPTSTFLRNWICSIATPEGRISVSDDFLTITQNGKKNKLRVRDKEHRKILIQKYFSIQIQESSIKE